MKTVSRQGVTITNTDLHETSIAFALGWTLGWGTGAIRALVAMKGWEWFVADTFGVLPLSFVQTWGLVMLLHFISSQFTNTKNDLGPLPAVISGLITSLATSVMYFVSMFVLSACL